MVKLRMKRTGRTHRPYYRIVAVDMRTRRDGNPIEELGHYDPLETDVAKAIVINPERALHWLSVGAQPSDTVKGLLRKVGIAKAAAK